MVQTDAYEGSALCRHLPTDIRVFSVQRVPTKFDGRESCTSRVYSMYVPAGVLSLHDDGSDGDAQVMARLRTALQAFEGSKPFHNYTRRCDACMCVYHVRRRVCWLKQ